VETLKRDIEEKLRARGWGNWWKNLSKKSLGNTEAFVRREMAQRGRPRPGVGI